MSLDMIKSELESRLKMAPPIGYEVALDFEGDGKLFLHADNSVTDTGAGDPDTTLAVSLDTMRKIISGESDPNMAVLMGKMKVSGKMGVALKLAGYLGD